MKESGRIYGIYIVRFGTDIYNFGAFIREKFVLNLVAHHKQQIKW